MRGRNPCIQQPASCIRSRVGAPRLELGTSALSGPRSNQLSYAPGSGLQPPRGLTILRCGGRLSKALNPVSRLTLWKNPPGCGGAVDHCGWVAKSAIREN